MARAYGKPTEAQLRRINELAKTPLTADEVFVFNGKMIGDGLIPDRYHRMKKSSLNNFRNEAKEGVSFLLDHSWAGFAPPKAALPYGKTFDAVLRKLSQDEVVGDETQAVFTDHYIPRGLEIDSISTDAIIRQIETGILSDTSIGWYGGKFICSICGGNYLRYSECQHFAGQEYDGQVCEVHIEDAHLMENSGVFDGAYPGAGILSADGPGGQGKYGDLVMVDDATLKNIGDPTTRVFGTYSAKSGIALYVPRGAVSVNNQTQKLSQNGTNSKTNGTQGKEEDALDKQLQELKTKVDDLTGQLSQKDTALAQATQSLATETAAKEALQAQITALQADLDTQKAEVSRLQPLAEDGKAFKAYMIGEAHKWGVKAMGNAYKQDLHEKIFATLSIAEITEFKDGFEAKAREELGTGRISQQANPGDADHSLRGNGGVPDPETDEKAFRAKVAERANQLKAEGKAKTTKEAMSMANAELRKEAK